MMLAGSGAASAQVTPPSQADISRERLALPPIETPKFDLRIQAPDRSAVPKAVDAIEFQLRDVVVEGVTAFSPEVVDGFFAGVKGKRVGLAAVREAAAALEERYREKSYFLTRVFIPPQQIDDETIKVTVIEGFIEDITVEGLDEGTRRAVKAALSPLLGHKPIDLPSLERQLLILNDIPGISGSSVLRQGTTLGGSSLIVTLDKAPNSYQLAINNGASRILGPWAYATNANFNRPFNLPGAFDLGLSAGGRDLQAVQTVSGRYSVAVGNSGLLASFGVLAARARPGGSVRPLNIVNNAISISARVRYPIIRGRALSLFAEAGLSVNRSNTDILGAPLIRDRTTDLDMGLSLQQNGWLNGSTSVSVSLFQGLQVLGAIGRTAPAPSTLNFNPAFTRLVYSIQRSQQLPDHFSAVIAFQGQYTGSKLLSGELISFGGSSIGRGYDPSAITGDRGYGGLAELRYDLPVTKSWIRNLQFYSFVDGGRTTSVATAVIQKSSQSIRSAGGGLRVYHPYGMIDFQLAYASRRLGGADDRANPRALISATFAY
ncbi:ShlB/FhaC/HecB family hemolysin secretion/activation protein [Sphingomonas sp. 28-63-12]|uniref:ShlB/FhaC/HecB family hemolysin secretion/activation protein n=1 Tax=Sphingomonas sp. 28-63-12 TaxID=1970434 RepID=UPI0035A91E43